MRRVLRKEKMIKAQYINLNMVPSGVMPVLYCSQYDVGRPLGMVVYNGGEAVDLSTYTVTIEGTRTDGTPITAAVTTDGNIGGFATTATMTNKADSYQAKMVIADSSGNRVASLAFVMMVTPKTMDENAESIEEDASLYQQYTETVQTLIAEIREELTDLKNQMMIYALHLSDIDEAGAMTLFKYPNGKVICVDSGNVGESDAIDSKMAQYGITHIDIMITSHFHNDHVGNFEHVANTYCDASTVFYRSMDWDTTKIGYTSVITPAQYEAIIESLGAVSLIPTQNQTITPWDDCEVRFLNTDSSFLASYYTAQSDSNVNQYTTPSINNLSLIVEIKFKRRTILMTADAEYQAQYNNASYIKKVDILNIPHHNWNMNGYYKFFEAASPDFGFFNRNNYLSTVAGCPHYWDKLKYQDMGEIPTYQTVPNDVVFAVGDDEVIVKGGNLYTYQSALAVNPSAGNVLMGKDIPYYTSDVSWWANNTWSIKDVLALYNAVPYASAATVFINSGYFKKFGDELQAMNGQNFSKYTLIRSNNALTLVPTGNTRFEYIFSDGFDYDDQSTWNTRYYNNYTQLMTRNLQYSTALTPEDDLFALNIMGEYYAETNAIASAISNSPTKFAFRVEIGLSNDQIASTGRRYMRLIDYTGREWYSYKNSGSTWIQWVCISNISLNRSLDLMDAVSLTATDDLFSLYGVGEYFASTNNIASAVGHSPTTNAFRAEIGYANMRSGRKFMRVIDYTGAEWYTFTNSNNLWNTTWKVIVS